MEHSWNKCTFIVLKTSDMFGVALVTENQILIVKPSGQFVYFIFRLGDTSALDYSLYEGQ